MAKKKQKSSSNEVLCKIGDILAIKLGEESYAFAGIINIRNGWNLAALLAKTSDKPEYSDEIAESKLLFPPVSFALNSLEKKELIIVGSEFERFQIDLSNLIFYMGTKGAFRTVQVNSFKPGERITDNDAKKLPRWEFYTFGGLVKRVKPILKKGTVWQT